MARNRGWSIREARLNELRERDGCNCFYCGCVMSFERGRSDAKHPPNLATIDHIIPLSQGGRDNLENCVAACFQCNNEKSYGDPAGFLFAKSFVRIFVNA